MQVPKTVRTWFSHFPLVSLPPIESRSTLPENPTLWIQSPRSIDSTLSADVECLKWQAYLALRGLSGIKIRTDVDVQGAMDARLPSLCVPKDGKAELLSAHLIPGWTDAALGVNSLDDPLEGYKSEAARDESRAWVSLLEGNIHAALIFAEPSPSILTAFFAFSSTVNPHKRLESILTPPPPPVTGILSFFPPLAPRISPEAIESQYSDAIGALSERLGTDKWFLGSDNPTPLDALVFAYLHCLLHTPESVRVQVTRRVNLVAWEWRVRSMVRVAFSRV